MGLHRKETVSDYTEREIIAKAEANWEENQDPTHGEARRLHGRRRAREKKRKAEKRRKVT